MRLSTAILIGSQISKKCKGQLNDGQGGRCVMGAALDAGDIKVLPFTSASNHIAQAYKIFPFTSIKIGKRDSFYTDSMWNFIARLNNDTEMTREQIAGWVRRMEDKYLREGRVTMDQVDPEWNKKEEKTLEVVNQ